MHNLGGLQSMNTYYLTEMNTIKLENCLLRFIFQNNMDPVLVNGVVSKLVSLMYNNNIDYYYSDTIATAVNVPVKFVDNIYLHNQSKYYNDSLATLLGNVEGCNIAPESAEFFEHEVTKILETKKRINTKKNKFGK